MPRPCQTTYVIKPTANKLNNNSRAQKFDFRNLELQKVEKIKQISNLERLQKSLDYRRNLRLSIQKKITKRRRSKTQQTSRRNGLLNTTSR